MAGVWTVVQAPFKATHRPQRLTLKPINRPYLSQTFNNSGKLTIEEKVLSSFSKYSPKYLGDVNFSHLEQNFGNYEFILKIDITINVKPKLYDTF